jgi:hypothetical protein
MIGLLASSHFYNNRDAKNSTYQKGNKTLEAMDRSSSLDYSNSPELVFMHIKKDELNQK